MTCRLPRPGDDRGSALAFAMMITTVVLVLVATMLATINPGTANSKRSQDSAAALIAARSGIDDVIAYLMGIQACRSESKVCTAALQVGDDASKQVTSESVSRPALTATPGYAAPFDRDRSGQSFTWAIQQTLTPEGFLRVTSTGKYQDTTKTLVADLALNPSILVYGYYSDYEAFAPQFLRNYYKPRSVYISDSSIYSNVPSGTRGTTTVPRYANWKSPTAASADNCGQHWYYESAASPGRKQNGSAYAETGTLGASADANTGTAVSRSGGCDLVFSSSMVQNGKTFTRDAINASGTGPKFNDRVFTLWGYKDTTKNYTNPAFDSASKYYRGDTIQSSPKLPEIAGSDLVLRKSIGKDGIPTNACVYEGPTRVKLTGDGSATVTSPATRAATRTRNPNSPDKCYPASLANGVIGHRVNYGTTGSGAIVVRNLGTAPTTGWPVNGTRSTQTPAAGNEVFYFPATGTTDVTQHADKSAAPSAGCTSTVKYAATVDAACAWTGVATTTDSTSTTGWTSYTSARCDAALPANRQLFECEYANAGSTTTPTVAAAAGQYKTLRDNVQTDLNNAATCPASDTTANEVTCLNNVVANRVKVANTGGTVSGTATTGARRYVATTTAGTPVTTTVATGNAGAGPDNTTGDSFFTQPSPARETLTRTPFTTTVKRQTYSSSNGWSGDVAAFTLTTTQSDYTYTAPRGATYFPDVLDVTDYSTGADAAGAARGTGLTQLAGDRQPGDLYIDGDNKGKLSVLAENDVVVTGNITNPSGYTPATDAVSVTAEQDVRNYHPVKCTDQDAADINNTTPGWCPNDITGLSTSSFISGTSYTSAAPAQQYVNLQTPAARTVQAAIFALSGSFGTDNYNRGDAVGNLNVKGGLFQSRRGGNGVVSGSAQLSGTNLQYTFEDLQRSELPYVPPSTTGLDVRPWNVVSVSLPEPDPPKGP